MVTARYTTTAVSVVRRVVGKAVADINETMETNAGETV